jgi:hypothetical protein
MTEWELLVAAEDIEQGDSIKVDLEDGNSTSMVFISATGSKVKLLDQDGAYHSYSTSSLEELGDGNSFITGKSDEELNAGEILRNARG